MCRYEWMKLIFRMMYSKDPTASCGAPSIIVLVLIIIFTSLMGCTKSLVYSPSMNLSPKPLKKGQTQFLGGIGQFPETRPHEMEKKEAYGAETTFRYAICDHFTLQAKGWKDLSDNIDINRLGFSFSIIAMLNDSSKIRFGLMPTGVFVFGDGEMAGGGGGLFFATWYNIYRSINLYSTIGSAFGLKDASEERKKWGWGVLLNVGTAVLIKDHIAINIELAAIRQVNEYEDISDNFICPSLNVGYIF